MAESPSTRPSLLVRLRDPADGTAWSQFVEIYAPLIYGFGRKHGLQDADAADLTQEVLRIALRAIGKLEYDTVKGSFRGWLFTVVRNQLRTMLSKRQRLAMGTGDTGMHEYLEQQPAPQEAESEWEKECERRLFAHAADLVRHEVNDRTWKAFWETAVEGKDAKAVALNLDLSVAGVYLAKSRVMARLRHRVQEWDGS